MLWCVDFVNIVHNFREIFGAFIVIVLESYAVESMANPMSSMFWPCIIMLPVNVVCAFVVFV